MRRTGGELASTSYMETRGCSSALRTRRPTIPELLVAASIAEAWNSVKDGFGLPSDLQVGREAGRAAPCPHSVRSPGDWDEAPKTPCLGDMWSTGRGNPVPRTRLPHQFLADRYGEPSQGMARSSLLGGALPPAVEREQAFRRPLGTAYTHSKSCRRATVLNVAEMPMWGIPVEIVLAKHNSTDWRK